MDPERDMKLLKTIGVMWGITFALVLLIVLTSCASTQQSKPIDTVDVVLPTHECEEPPTLLPVVIPERPVYPGDDATEGEKKAFYEAVGAWHKSVIEYLEKQIEARDKILDGYRKK